MIDTEIINKKQVCKLLHTSPKMAQKILEEALKIKDSGVFKLNNIYRIDKNIFLKYLINKDKN